MRIFILALSLAAAAATAASAQDALPGDPASLFISPCGKPYRSNPGEPYPVAAWFSQVDANKDGAIDRAELRAEAAGFFSELDLDKDALISSQEVRYYEYRIVPEIGASQLGGLDAQAFLFQAQMSGMEIVPGGGAQSAPKSRGYKPLVTGAVAYNLLGDAQPVSAADADLNSRITPAEFQAASDRRFARLDRNADGKLTMDELPQTLVQKLLRPNRGKGRKG